MLKLKFSLALLLPFMLVRPAHADMVWSDAYKNPMSDWGAYMYDQNVKRHLRESVPSTSQPASPSAPTQAAMPATPPPPRVSITATDFVRSANGQDLVAQLVTSTNLPADQGAQLATGLNTMINQFKGAGRKDNVATAMTLLIGLSYGVLEKPGFDLSKVDDLIPAVNDALAASPQFASLGAAQRQQMYDSLLLSAAVIGVVNQKDKQAGKTLASQALNQLGIPN